MLSFFGYDWLKSIVGEGIGGTTQGVKDNFIVALFDAFYHSGLLFGILFGVVPEHQGLGVDGAVIMASRELWQSGKMHYTEYEMNWIGDFNPKMIQVIEQVGGYIAKRHITYRKLFDETKPFKRHPILR